MYFSQFISVVTNSNSVMTSLIIEGDASDLKEDGSSGPTWNTQVIPVVVETNKIDL